MKPIIPNRLSPEKMANHAESFRKEMESRHSVRSFASTPVSETVIRECVSTAGTAPSGANRQPWFFAIVRDANLKRKIRTRAEQAEREFYAQQSAKEWHAALGPLGTHAEKPFLEQAPYLIAVFSQQYGVDADGSRRKNYYVPTSVGIAIGMLLTAIHHAGLVALPYTPSGPDFMRELLGRPPNEKLQIILAVGHPPDGVKVPELRKKAFEEIASLY